MPFNYKTVIIIPSQGDGVYAFENTAQQLKKEIYDNATIVRTTVVPSEYPIKVTLKTIDRHGFEFSAGQDLERVLTVSHAGKAGGPNLGFGLNADYQAWKNYDAMPVWKSVAASMTGDGKIILLGCHMGDENGYASDVFFYTKKTVFAAMGDCAAGNGQSAVKWVNAIEANNTPKNFKKFGK
jgi:hypothetical protein